MASHPESLDHMLAAWNESDPGRVRSHLELALAPDVVFIDPTAETFGIDEFEANVHDAHRKLPGASYERMSGVATAIIVCIATGGGSAVWARR